MQVLLRLAEKRPHLLTDYVGRVKQAAETYPSTLCLAAQVITAVGKLSKVSNCFKCHFSRFSLLKEK